MKLPDLRDFDLTEKKVLLRCDFDVPLIIEQESERVKEWKVGDDTRIQDSLLTINLLLSKKTKIIILSHLGRPEGKVVPELSLRPVAKKLGELLNEKLKIKNEKLQSKIKNFSIYQLADNLVLLENLRFNSGEEGNSPEFAQKLASLGEFYINDAFAVCHREHASIVGLPKLLPHAAGFSLLKEVEVLSRVLENPKKPVVVILGGAKEDKLEVVGKLQGWADYILIGGKLPLIITNKYQFQISNERIIIGMLNESGKDITLETIEKFGEIIKNAGTIIWSGPMGQYESEVGRAKWEVGTRKIAEAVVNSGAFTVIGGGDTEAALTKFSLVDKIDYVSSGGGAMLEFLANGDLPGLKALRV
ncbi:MAG: phosphoglycerate kinase [Patescibacteria group bacterium]